FGVVLLAVAAVIVWSRTGGGARTVGSMVTDKLRAAIRGNFSVRQIEMRGLLAICADQVDLRDPDGNPALAADRICLHVNPLALPLDGVLLSDVELVRPRIEIAAVEEPDGRRTTTLSRALEARNPKPAGEGQPQAQGEPFKWVIDVSRLQLEDGSIA